MWNYRMLIIITVLVTYCILAFSLISPAALDHTVPPLIRLHILANSDSQHDQELKTLVRDHIVQSMTGRFKDSDSLDESRQVVLASLDDMTDIARQTLRDAGCGDEVRTYYGAFAFPTRYYGQFSLPAGTYEAVRIVIGEGKGANWWCVLFPPLCFVGSHPQNLAGTASPPPQSLNKRQQNTIKIKPALKIVELLLK